MSNSSSFFSCTFFPHATTSTANRQLLCRLDLQIEHALQHPFCLLHPIKYIQSTWVKPNWGYSEPHAVVSLSLGLNHLIKQQFRRSATKELMATSLISHYLNNHFFIWPPYQFNYQTAVITHGNLSLARRCPNGFSRRDKHWFITWSFHCSNLF